MTSSSTRNLNQLINSIPVRRHLHDQNKREEFEWSQWQSATKSINNDECPVKEKHVRNLITGTFQLESARLFWSMISRIHVESHPIISWKFCYVVHRLLREGHQNVIDDSIKIEPYADQLRKYWSGLQHNYGVLSYRYFCFINRKLKFHQQNPIFCGNLSSIRFNDIREFLPGNVDKNLQLCTDLFDYMTEILLLMQTIFTSFDQSRSNSSSPAGQCRLQPLVICVQDSSCLYDHIVRILFYLHEVSSANNFTEYQQRFEEQYQKLKIFYNQLSKIQYLKNLIPIPKLSENPPNFKSKNDSEKHQIAISIAENSPGTSIAKSVELEQSTSSITILEQQLAQCNTMLEQSRSETDDLHRTISTKDAELMLERNTRIQLEEQCRQLLDEQKREKTIENVQQKKNNDEKFTKLLETYRSLDESHRAVLRQNGDLQKKLIDFNNDFSSMKDENQSKIDECFRVQQQLQNEIVQLRQTNEELQSRIQSLSNERNDYEILSKKAEERLKEIEQEKKNVDQRLKELETMPSAQEKLKQVETIRRDLLNKTREQQEDLIDLIYEKEMLNEKVMDYERTIREMATKFISLADKQKVLQKDHEVFIENLREQYKQSMLTYAIHQMRDSMNFNPEKSNGLRLQLQIALTNLKTFENFSKSSMNADESNEDTNLTILHQCTTIAQCFINIYQKRRELTDAQTKITLEQCRDLINDCIQIYTEYQTSHTVADLCGKIAVLINRLNQFIDLQ